jgi:CheY-like chemotaxis protein
MAFATMRHENIPDPGPDSGGADPRLSVLIVDDNAAAAQTLGWMLEMFGHEVRLAHDGAEALRLAQESAPQVVLLDLGLPGMDGCETCRRLRGLPGLERTLFAAQTGWDQPQHRATARAAGFAHHLVKPVALEALRGVLAQAAA